MAVLGNFFETMVKSGFIFAGAVLSFSYLTKPEEKTLNKSIESQTTEKIIDDGPLDYLAKKMGSKLATTVGSTNFKDYLFFRTAEITLPNGERFKFVGVVQNWIPVPSTFPL